MYINAGTNSLAKILKISIAYYNVLHLALQLANRINIYIVTQLREFVVTFTRSKQGRQLILLFTWNLDSLNSYFYPITVESQLKVT